jgi:carboxyl-terminal processing protease
METITEAQRVAILNNVLANLDRHLACTEADAPDLRELRRAHQEAIVRAPDADVFEVQMNAMLHTLGWSHLGFHHEARPRAAARMALAATFTAAETPDGKRWVFQDIHEGGVAARGGLRRGDVLLTLDERNILAPSAPPLRLGVRTRIGVRRPDGSTHEATVDIPGSKEKTRPVVVPTTVVTASKLEPDLGLIRVAMFPGILGIDVARDISRAIHELDCSRLVFDLRGNTGGGIGGLRLMSHLSERVRGVGYSVGRKELRAGYDKQRLPRFGRIPTSKWGVLPLVPLAFKRSIAVFSEDLGAQKHHGRVAMLVNEHSAGAAEMVAAFAPEYQLATLVGTPTAGRLVGASSFKVGHGYRVAMPVAAYFTWRDTNLDGRGLTPDIIEALPVAALWRGADPQLVRAAAAVTN